MISNDKKYVLLRAPSLTQSGYGVHARQIAKWLFDYAEQNDNIEIHTELLNWGQTPWITNVHAYDGLIGKIYQASSFRREKYDVSIQLQLPNEWYPGLAEKNIGITAGVEADRVNPAWIACCNKMDLVIVPSEYSKRAFVNTGGLKTKIEVVPESFMEEISDMDNKPALELDVDTKFNFLIFGQLTNVNPDDDRKRIAYTIKWLCEEFKQDKNVGIILKTNIGRNTALDRKMTENMLVQLREQVSESEFPRLHLMHGHMDNDDIVGLYKNNTIKALVSLSAGEGWGLPIIDAAAAGLPVIVANYSAPVEYLKHGRYIAIDSGEGPVPQGRIDGQIFIPGSMWGYVSEQDFKKKARKFYEGSTVPREWAAELRKKIMEKYSIDSVKEIYTSKLKDYL